MSLGGVGGGCTCTCARVFIAFNIGKLLAGCSLAWPDPTRSSLAM